MRSKKTLNSCLVFLVISTLALALGCGGGDDGAAAAEARAEAWAEVTQFKDELTAKRTDRTALADQIAAAGAGVVDGAEALTEEAKAELETQLKTLGSEVDAMTEDLSGRLVAFINDGQMERGAEPTESQLAAFRLKASEDLLVADEYGELGGDWAGAIRIAEAAEQLDPTNPEVLARLEHYRSMRYMTEERLALAEKGMTLDEVKVVLGEPSRGNDRKHSDTRRSLYYMKSPARDAAAVFFQLKNEEWIAYKVDFNAIPGNKEE